MLDIDKRKQELYILLSLAVKEQRLKQIEALMSQTDFWRDYEKAQQLTKELSDLKKTIKQWQEAQSLEQIELLEKQLLFADQYDQYDAIVAFHAGAGGTEAADWASMLKNMIEKWAAKNGFEVFPIDESKSEEAGIKSATIKVSGQYAYGNLKSEAGVHRLVRISPFDADKSRHTSFAAIEVIPELAKTDQIKIDPKDLKYEFFRAGGHGGQNVNKVETAVRIAHLPTGITVTSQNQRSQIQNRQEAEKVLFSKLAAKMREKNLAEIAQLRGEHVKIEWGSQIRSYVLYPYQLVKDNRTGYEEANAESVLEGNINNFIETYLKNLASKR